MPNRRQPIMSFGMLLLAHKLMGSGLRHIPPVTLLTILCQAALYVGIINPPWDRYDVCLSGESILIYKDYRRLFLSAIEHADDLHLYYNMASFIVKGRTLERWYGTSKFIIVLLSFIMCTSGIYVALAKAAYMFFDDYKYMKECAIGFSGVLFALKVLTTFESNAREQWVHGFMVPAKFAVWVELLIIHLLVPRASFMGHLAGIFTGILFVEGPLRHIIDAIHNLISTTLFSRDEHETRGPTGGTSYTYARGTPSSHQDTSYGSQSYGWSNNVRQEEFVDAEELRRRTERYMY